MVKLCIGMMMGVLLAGSGALAAKDSLVSFFEASNNIAPGDTRVVPNCQCTIRYEGTKITGRHYDVMFEKLD